MNEVEKMYSNVGIEPTYTDECQIADSYYSMERDLNERGILFDDYMKQNCPNKNVMCYETCPYAYNKEFYPPFTAEKQLALFKMFCRRYLEVSQHVEENGDLCFGIKATIGDFAVGFNKDFAECLADFVNCLWQDLTEEERTQIKEILE